MITKIVSYVLVFIACSLLLAFGANTTVNMIDFIYHQTEPMAKEYQPSPTLSAARHQINDPAQSHPSRHLTNARLLQSDQPLVPPILDVMAVLFFVGMFVLVVISDRESRQKRKNDE